MKHYEIYKKLGAHLSEENGVRGVFFAVWAPNATAVHVVGDFNAWDESAHLMEREESGGIWQLFIPRVREGALYKYLIETQDGRMLYKADPFANASECRPGTASIVADLRGFRWTDSKWLEKRDSQDVKKQPLAIYECHIGSWMKHPMRGTPEAFYNYREFADRITEYLKEMKYTHVELMGIAEHPFDGSWGYQVTGYYAPTSRYGSPKDFMYLVNTLHKNGIGVILDWVPAHFTKDAHGLAEFDGTCLFEHPDPRRGEHPDWGTKVFDYSRAEVKNFLLANVLFWLKEFHIDGIRVDAVASMLYLNYGRQDGQWLPNANGGYENLDAIAFFQQMNEVVRGQYPGFLTIAEESTAWPHVTSDVGAEGLGFTYKWNMGWMHDFCQYMRLDPIYRKYNHHALTFAMSYNESENYILPLSHDEVVHLKCSMVNKMYGSPEDKYASLRAGYAYMFGHAGKKLLFMGQDFGQEREWSEERELDWFLLQERHNLGLHHFVRDLLKLYRKYPAMYELDDSWAGFEWMNADDLDRSTYSFVRKASNGRNSLLFVINMTPVKWENYIVRVPKNKTYKLVLNSDDFEYGGNGSEIPQEIEAKVSANMPEAAATDSAKKENNEGKAFEIVLDLPAYGAAVFVF